MARTGRPKAELTLTDAERSQLVSWSRRAKSSQALALRCPGSCWPARTGRQQYAGRPDWDLPGDGGQVAEPVRRQAPGGLGRRGPARSAAVDHSGPGRRRRGGHPGVDPEERHPLVAGLDGGQVGAVAVHDRPDLARLRPQAASADSFKLSTDPQFVEKVVDVVGLYHNPPEKAVVLCVDEKCQMQALDRSQPVLPMMPGMPERRTHDYVRHGITTLFAAFNIADGTVISETAPPAPRDGVQEVPHHHRQDRARGPGRPRGLRQLRHPQDAGDQGLADQPSPRSTCTSPRPAPAGSTRSNAGSAFLTDQLIRRGVHKSVQSLEADLRAWITAGTMTRSRSCGPRPPKRSSTPSSDIFNEFPAGDTSLNLSSG